MVFATFSLRRLFVVVGLVAAFVAGLIHENSLLVWGMAAVVVLSVPISCVLGLVDVISLPFALTYAAVATAYSALPFVLGPTILYPTLLTANLASRLNEGRPRNPVDPTAMGYQVMIVSHLLCTLLLASASGWLAGFVARKLTKRRARIAPDPAEGHGAR